VYVCARAHVCVIDSVNTNNFFCNCQDV